ncbi:Uma2 family endonuclease [filamentous cyanobacterium LEGE 11480]|uniref:Uma2 family endonuclease n=1 Tax=Romeriopsis navalis LEGE 11480 TaxID=2777977 RepID=A0A928VML6_9CYAN|nr:Uma2 family endonuclease [Romeriopsis navalis]MBE9028769.1 Uma2 family endonuclease [Romeriopsis navalis LEGE 11480]
MVSAISRLAQAATVSNPSRPLQGLAGAVLLQNLSWDALEKLDVDLVGTGARLTYLDGYLEIMSPPSEAHEVPKKTIAQLLEAYMRLKQIRFYGRGSTTIGLKTLGARKEPDESYCIGERKQIPDFALEVTVTSGGIDVLEIYKRVGVSEVWFWEDGVILIYCLREAGYELVNKSELLPNLDIRSLEFHSRMADQYDAINAFIESLNPAS